ncbi:MAG: AsmA family protein, partial [Planctomycetota bacterium]
MRRWWIALGFVVLVLLAVVIVAVLNLNRLLNQNREVIAERAQRAVGREIRFGELRVSFARGLAVRVQDLHVGDDPAFSEEGFVSAEAVDVGVHILPALFGRIEVGRVVLRNGALRFIDRTATPPAELRVARIDFVASEVSLTDPVSFELSAAVLGATEPNLNVSGTVGPLQADSPGADFDLSLDPLVVDEALRLKQVASTLPPELSASGPVRVDVETRGTLAKLRFDAKLDARRAAVRYGESFEKAEGVPLYLSLRGEKTGDDLVVEAIDATIDETELRGRATVKNLDDPTIDFSLTSPAIALASFGASDRRASPPDVINGVALDGSLTLPRAGPELEATLRSEKGAVSGEPYQKLAADLRLANQRLDIEKLSLDALGGALATSGFYDMKDAQRPRFDLRIQLADTRIEKILESQAPAAARFISGGLGTTLDLRGTGAAWEQIKSTLTGAGDIRIADGVIRDFNPAGPTLRAVMELPALSSTALRQFLDEHSQVFGVSDTPFDAIDGKLEIRDGWVHARDFALAAGDYALSGSGRYSLDNRLDSQLVMTFSQKLSEDLIAS